MQMTKIIGAMALVATALTGVMASPAEAHWKRKNHYHASNYDNDDYYDADDDHNVLHVYCC